MFSESLKLCIVRSGEPRANRAQYPVGEVRCTVTAVGCFFGRSESTAFGILLDGIRAGTLFYVDGYLAELDPELGSVD